MHGSPYPNAAGSCRYPQNNCTEAASRGGQGRRLDSHARGGSGQR